MKRAVLYARYSNEKQNSKSADDQLKLCRRLCEKEDFLIIKEFKDDALTGTDIINRSGFHAMEEFIRSAHVDVVVSEDLSRLNRNMADSSAFYEWLTYHNVKIFTVNDGKVGKVHIGMKGTMDDMQIDSIRQMTKRGQEAAVLDGRIPGGKIYGYTSVPRIIDGKAQSGFREFNPEEVKVVQRIFAEYRAGATLQKICNGLNNDGILSPSGKTWQSSVLCGTWERQTGILRNTIYKGLVTFNRLEYRKDPETGKKKGFPRPESEWVLQPAPQLTIIDEDLFDEVQRMLRLNSSVRGSGRTKLKDVTKQEFGGKYTRERTLSGAGIKTKNRKAALVLFSHVSTCKKHQTKITISGKSGYSCRAKDCSNKLLDRFDMTRAALKAMKEISLDFFLEHERDHKKKSDKIKRQIMEKEALIKPLHEKNWQLMQTFGDEKPSQFVLDEIKSRDQEVASLEWHRDQDLENLKKYHCKNDRIRTNLVQKFHRMIDKVYKDPTDAKSTALLRKCLKEAEYEAIRGKIYCEISLDFTALYAVFNTIKGAK